jgi:hypothetical protein
MSYSAERSHNRPNRSHSYPDRPPAPPNQPCSRHSQSRRHPHSLPQLLVTLRDRISWPTTCPIYCPLSQEDLLADLIDSTLMYLRDLFDPNLTSPPIKEVRRVLDFFGWQEIGKNSGVWINLDAPGASIKITTSDSGLLLCHIEHPDGRVRPLLEALPPDSTDQKSS